MFGKLLKNDLKAQFFTIFPVLIIMGILIAGLEIWHFTGTSDSAKYLSGLYVFLVFLFACFVMVIAVAMMFNRSVFGKEGYLTLSLPVKTGNLVISKMLSGLIWIATPFILSIVSIYLWFVQTIQEEFDEEVEAGELLLEILGAPSLDVILVYALMFCIGLAVSIILIVQCIYFGITLSHVSPLSKLGKFGAIVFTFAIFIIWGEISSMISEALPLGIVIDIDSVIFTDNIPSTMRNAGEGALSYNFVSFVTDILFALGLNFPIVYFIKNKINI